jgi:hypothetical protein
MYEEVKFSLCVKRSLGDIIVVFVALLNRPTHSKASLFWTKLKYLDESRRTRGERGAQK